MSQAIQERRRWQRIPIVSEARIRIPHASYTARVIDISGGGALLSVNAEALNADPMGLSILHFGEYDAVVTRQWEDGIAVRFHHDEHDQFSLQEDLEAFCRENEYDNE